MQRGLARLEVRLARSGRSACRCHQSRPCVRHLCSHNLVCVRHLYIRHLVCNHSRALRAQQGKKDLGKLERLERRLDQRLPLRPDRTMHIELEPGFGKQTSSRQQRVSKFVIEVALKILFHSRKNNRRKSVLRRSRLPQNIIVSLLAVITAARSC